MTNAELKDLIADLICEHALIRNEYGEDPSVDNPNDVAAIILERIQETYLVTERLDSSNHSSATAQVDPAKMDAVGRKIAEVQSWAGQVDRQGGSFTDQEILDSYTWR